MKTRLPLVLLGMVLARDAGADAQTLAREKLAGTVLVPSDATLHSSLAVAKSSTAKTSGEPVAMRVVKDHGDVVELATGNVTDCLTSYQHDYDLTVFVRRSALVVRSGVPMVRHFKDGTAVAIDAGAPVIMTSSGPTWRSRLLAATGVKPDPKQLRYSIPTPVEASLPAATGDRMVCEDYPQTHADWKRARERKAEEAKREKARKLEEEREACRARQARKPKKPKKRTNPVLDVLGDDECGGIGAFDLGPSSGLGEALMGDMTPWCSATDATADKQEPEPLLGGKRIPWLLGEVDTNSDVNRVDTRFHADLGVACGRVRVEITAMGKSMRVGAAGGDLFGRREPEWTFNPGPVTWPDGTPAGRLVTTKTYRRFEARKDTVCVDVPQLAERVCHAKKNGSLRK